MRLCIALSLLLPLSSIWSFVELPKNYPAIIEKLIYYKDDQFKVFYGGPIDNKAGVKWMMPALFTDTTHQTRAVYEISFFNCLPDAETLDEVPLYFLRVSDIDIKFQNLDSESYNSFAALSKETCVLIREVDVSNIFYPEIFISDLYSDFKSTDLEYITHFLQEKYNVTHKLINLSPEKQSTSKTIKALIGETLETFTVDHHLLKDDEWKSYYVVTKGGDAVTQDCALLRIDSGCTSGQIYGDDACDCLDQLQNALASMATAPGSMLIHIPAQDGRGFGTAPKAETEIYKRGGLGRVNKTSRLDTVQAAITLYHTKKIDIRSYEGIGKILARYNIQSCGLLTDNKLKLKALKDQGIAVNRVKTNIRKASCQKHLLAKKNTDNYFGD